MKFKIHDITLMSLFAVVIAICSWIQIPSLVPFTLQTFAVFLCLLLLGGKKGTISIVIYISLGAVGLPVFHGFTSGIGALLGPTGGFILGFMLTGICYGIATKKASEKLKNKAFALLLGLILCYTSGTLWFIISTTSNSVLTAIATCVLPFILPDLLKLSLALSISKRLSQAIRK